MRRVPSVTLCCLFVCCLFVIAVATLQGQNVPAYKYDPTWPKLPLPNKWTFGGITGVAVDSDDVIWVLHRPDDLDETENYAKLTPPVGACCVEAPSMLVFDTQGNLLRSWNAPAGNLLITDKQGFVWIGSDEVIRKFTKDGKLVAEIGKGAPASNPPAGERPPDTPLLTGRVLGGAFDEVAREIFVADGHFNGRMMVFDMDTGVFKRGWGAYGKPLKDIRNAGAPHNPTAPAKDFLSHVTIAIARDGNVYMADRGDDRIQVFTKQGQFLKEFFVAPATLARGSAGYMALSGDPQQRHLLVSDIVNNVIRIVNRADGKTVGQFGFMGHSGGGFHWVFRIATDSKGHVYTGEVDSGKRVQRFLVSGN